MPPQRFLLDYTRAVYVEIQEIYEWTARPIEAVVFGAHNYGGASDLQNNTFWRGWESKKEGVKT